MATLQKAASVILNSLDYVAKLFSTKQIMRQMARLLHPVHLLYRKEKHKKVIKTRASHFVAGSTYNASFLISKLYALPKVPSFSHLQTASKQYSPLNLCISLVK